MKKLLFVGLLLLPLQAQAAFSQLNALSWAKADGTDQTANMQLAVNVAVSIGTPLYIPPGIVFDVNALTNLDTALLEDYTTPGRKINHGSLEVRSQGISRNDWGGPSVAQNIQGLIQATNVVNGAVTASSFGVLCDGTLADYQRLTNAIAVVAGSRGATLVLPPGTYTIYDSLTFTRDTDISVTGFSSVNSKGEPDNTATLIKLADGVNKPLLVKELGARINLTGIAFDGNKDNQTISTNGIWLKGTSGTTDRSTLCNILVRNVKGTAIVNDNRESRFYQIKCELNELDGIENTASSDVTFVDILLGFNGRFGFYANGANSFRVYRGDFYRNWKGAYITNCSNNEFYGVKFDANETSGVDVATDDTTVSYRNRFFGGSANANNFFLTHTGATNLIPSGTYSNFRLLGNNTTETYLTGMNEWENEFAFTNSYPKYLFEDLRDLYITNGLTGASVIFSGVSFRSSTNGASKVSELGAYQPELENNASGEWFYDGGVRTKNNINHLRGQFNQLRVTDQFESDIGGPQVNLFYGVVAGVTNWHHRIGGPGYLIRSRNDNGLFAIQYASSNAANSVAGLTNGMTINSTNGYVAIGKGETPAVVPLEVVGSVKASLLESRDGVLFNTYFDGSNFRLREDGYAFKIQAQNSYSNLVISITGSNAANSIVTWTNALTIRQNGTIDKLQFPVSEWAISSGTTGQTNRFLFGSVSTYHAGQLRLRETDGGTDEITYDGTSFATSIPIHATLYYEGSEQAEPDAPAANKGRLFFQDNGAGKTQLAVRFPTGATQVIATEP